MNNVVWLETTAKFMKVSLDEMKSSDIVYYKIPKHGDDRAHGPFLVKNVEYEPKRIIRLENGQCVNLNFNPDSLEFLKLDLISLATGDFT